jgi:hypothetical protein
MSSVLNAPAKVVAGICAVAISASAQNYTISAKPGAVNYIEGSASVNGQQVSSHAARTTFLGENDTLSTGTSGKAEVLLTPGIFLRIGDNSEVRMVSPSLTDTRVELLRGEAMVEVDQLVEENTVSVVDHGATVEIQKPGLYRVAADPAPVAATIEGKCEAVVGQNRIEVAKGHETDLVQPLKAHKFDRKKEDDLYAWSNIRAEYDAASSYQVAKNTQASAMNSAVAGGYGYGYGPNAYSGMLNPGWYWNSAFMGWAWLPLNGAFFSPFGYGFYGPGVVAYAPVVYAPLYAAGAGGGTAVVGVKKPVAVPVNATKPPAIGLVSSPAALEQARSQTFRAVASNGGFRTAAGTPAAAFMGGHIAGGGSKIGGGSASSSAGMSGPISGGSMAGAGSSARVSSSGMSSGAHASSGGSSHK